MATQRIAITWAIRDDFPRLIGMLTDQWNARNAATHGPDGIAAVADHVGPDPLRLNGADVIDCLTLMDSGRIFRSARLGDPTPTEKRMATTHPAHFLDAWYYAPTVGVWVDVSDRFRDGDSPMQRYHFAIDDKANNTIFRSELFTAPTHTEALSMARTYLSGLQVLLYDDDEDTGGSAYLACAQASGDTDVTYQDFEDGE